MLEHQSLFLTATKNQEMFLEFVLERYKAQIMCGKAVNTYPSII